MATRVKRRETLHTLWYRDMTALQLEADPGLIEPVASALLKFEMPGNDILPELQSSVTRWLPLMGADFQRITRDLIRFVYEMMSNTRTAGRFVLEIARQNGRKLGPISAHQVQMALNRLGGPGYGLVGEALLESVGLDYMFKPQRGRQDSGFALYEQPYERLRGLVRTWVSNQMNFKVTVGGPGF